MKRKRFRFPFNLDEFLAWTYVIAAMSIGLALIIISILSVIRK